MYSFDHEYIIQNYPLDSVTSQTTKHQDGKSISTGISFKIPSLTSPQLSIKQQLGSTCPANVLQFVATATDVTDECQGMRKAFKSSCSDKALALNEKKLRRKRRTDRKNKKNNHSRIGLSDRYSTGQNIQFHQNIEEIFLKNSSNRNTKDSNWSFTWLSSRSLNTDTVDIIDDADEVFMKLPTSNDLETPTDIQNMRNPSSDKPSVRNQDEVVEDENFDLKPCCTAILKSYHDECDDLTASNLSDRKLGVIVVVIVLCGLVKSLIRNYEIHWLSEAGGCILVGMLAGLIIQLSNGLIPGFDETFFLRVMLPPIVFQASVAINKPSFNFHLIPILVFAIFGTIFAAAMTGFLVHYGSSLIEVCPTIPIIESMAFGSLISSIDPVATLSILSSIGVDEADTIYVLVFGESLLNDGVAVVLFNTLLHFMDDNMVIDKNAVFHGVLNFSIVSIGSVAVGLLCGLLCTIYFRFMHGCHTAMVEVLVFCSWALIPYYICDDFEWSGIVALVAMGFMMDLYVLGAEDEIGSIDSINEHSRSREQNCLDAAIDASNRLRRRPVFNRSGHLSASCKKHVGFVLEVLATTLETAIFAYLGMFLFNSRYHWNFWLGGIAIIACIVSRAIMILFMSCFTGVIGSFSSRKDDQSTADDEEKDRNATKQDFYYNIPRSVQLVLWFSGLRGAMSFALVEFIPIYDKVSGHGSPFKPELKAMTCASIFFTIFVFGGATFYLLRFLGYSNKISFNKEDGVPLVDLDDKKSPSPRSRVITPSKRNNNNGDFRQRTLIQDIDAR